MENSAINTPKKYELMIIISSEITDDEIDKKVQELKALLGSEIVFEEIWGLREFAYPIKNQPKGYYVIWNFLSKAEDIIELKETLKLSPNLLRYLLLQVPQNYSPITLAEIEAGLDKLRQEKADRRTGKLPKTTRKKAAPVVPGTAQPQKEQETTADTEAVEEKIAEKPTMTEPEPSPEAPGAGESATATPEEELAEPPAKPEEKTPVDTPTETAPNEQEQNEAKKKSLDEKLEKILQGDDLNDLGL